MVLAFQAMYRERRVADSETHRRACFVAYSNNRFARQ